MKALPPTNNNTPLLSKGVYSHLAIFVKNIDLLYI